MTVTVKVNLDRVALRRELRSRTGTTGRVMAGWAGTVTRSVRAEATRKGVKRRTGAYLAGISSTVKTGAGGLRVEVSAAADHSGFIESGTRPHIIVPVRAKVLRFTTTSGVVFAARVRHPGTKAQHVLRDGVARAPLPSAIRR